MTASGIRVVKVGGSLFDYAAFVPAWQRWSAEQPPAAQVLIAGGGKLADAIRDADRVWSLGEETAHELCVDTLAISARLLAAILPESRLEVCWQNLQRCLAAGQTEWPLVFSPVEFLRHVEPQLDSRPLPHCWGVTSDSIAARIAHALAAEELVLLKSADPPPDASDRPPYVDEYFVQAARNLPRVRFVNLRRYA